MAAHCARNLEGGLLVKRLESGSKMGRAFEANQIGRFRYIMAISEQISRPAQAVLTHQLMDRQTGKGSNLAVQCSPAHAYFQSQGFYTVSLPQGDSKREVNQREFCSGNW